MMKKILFFLALMFSIFAARSQTYVVLSPVSDTNDPWYEPVDILANFRSAQVITYDPQNVEAVLPFLFTAQPRYVAVVVRPLDIDINFVRRFFMLSTQLDSDPFSDFSYGYICGATAQDAIDFVNRIIAAENANIQNYPLKVGGCVASSLNYVYNMTGDYMDFLNPVTYSQIYMETSDSGSGHDFFVANQNYMLANKVIDMGHNGDPHMIWLFDGGNMTPNPPVWNYDSTKIEDPAYARVGMSSYDMDSLNLYPAVAFNGACHSGEPKRVMVEGDIAATFGDTQWYTEFYTMSDTFSFALTMLKSGVTGYFAPCGANNANDQGEDVYNAFLYNEPLGDIHKRSNDGVVMGFFGNTPVLELYTQGAFSSGCDVGVSGSFDPGDWSGACYMLGGKANRIYFGDPLFNPFQPNHSDSLVLAKAVLDSVDAATVDVQINYHKPDAYTVYFPAWDKFHFGNTRVYLPVEMPDWFGAITLVEVLDSSAVYDTAFWAVEQFDGKQILHVEVDLPDDMYDEIFYSILLRVSCSPNPGMNESEPSPLTFSVYPNPAASFISFSAAGEVNGRYYCRLLNVLGQPVWQPEHLQMPGTRIELPELPQGIYYFELNSENGSCGRRKIIITE